MPNKQNPRRPMIMIYRLKQASNFHTTKVRLRLQATNKQK